MPLVYRVCRTASALMLSHGGSRLNASKPEANPKTRYPTPTQQILNIHRFPPWCVGICDVRLGRLSWCKGERFAHTRTQPHKSSNPLTRVSVSVDRIASQNIAACAASMAQSITHNHKIFPSCMCSYADQHFPIAHVLRKQSNTHWLSDSVQTYAHHPKAAKAPTKHNTQTSLSKRENMHWLAYAVCFGLRPELKGHSRPEALNLKA